MLGSDGDVLPRKHSSAMALHVPPQPDRTGMGEASAPLMARLEARVMEIVAAFQRQQNAAMMDIDRLAEFSRSECVARLKAFEERQDSLERQLAARSTPISLPADPSPAPSPAADAESSSCLHAVQAALEQRVAALERRSCECGDEKPKGGSADEALQAVHVLEVMLAAELRGINKRCNVLQDRLEDEAVLPVHTLKLELERHRLQVEQLLASSDSNASRVEEHEFRLGVLRTRQEVHDGKLNLLDRSARKPSAAPWCLDEKWRGDFASSARCESAGATSDLAADLAEARAAAALEDTRDASLHSAFGKSCATQSVEALAVAGGEDASEGAWTLRDASAQPCCSHGADVSSGTRSYATTTWVLGAVRS